LPSGQNLRQQKDPPKPVPTLHLLVLAFFLFFLFGRINKGRASTQNGLAERQGFLSLAVPPCASKVALRLSRFDFEVFFLGTAMLVQNF
jgi:hypothetical protein